MQPIYFSLHGLICLIESPHYPICCKIIHDHRSLFVAVPGSSGNHQAWPGGYADHIREGMNLIHCLYPVFDAIRPLPFSKSDALLVFFLHDLEKLWKYELGPDGKLRTKPELMNKLAQRAFRDQKYAEYGLQLSADQLNGLMYCEGEHDDYSPSRRAMGPLAAFCHMADVASARLWPGYPIAEGDPWIGASRAAVSGMV